MKRFSPRKSFLCISLFLGVFVLSQVFFQPRSVLVLAQDNQDIDDVMQGFDADFGFQGKEDLKQTNLQNTNEQNREDIKIQEEEERQQQNLTTTMPTVGTTTTSTTPPPAAPTNLNVSLTFTVAPGPQILVISLGGIMGFNGTITSTTPVQVVNFLAVPLGPQILTVTCNSGGCSGTAISTPVNITSCTPPLPITTSIGSGPLVDNYTCTVG